MVKMILKIDGMACGMCESHINDTIRRSFKVKKVNSSHSKGETEIIAESPLDEETLKKAIGDTGYTVLSVHTEPYVKKGLFKR
ncbi:MAG: heavy-metal-associated domain-containing protein [Acutalibacteraceae bacterium]